MTTVHRDSDSSIVGKTAHVKGRLDFGFWILDGRMQTKRQLRTRHLRGSTLKRLTALLKELKRVESGEAAAGATGAAVPVELRERLREVCAELSNLIAHELKCRDKGLSLLQKTIALMSEEQVSDILQTATDALLTLSGAERGFLVLVTDHGLEAMAARNIGREHVVGPIKEFSHTLARKAIEERRTICLVNASSSVDLRNLESVSRLRLRSVLVVPLRDGGAVLGAIYLDNRKASGIFDEETVQLAETFSALAAIAVAKARQLDALQQSRKELEKELRQRREFHGIIGDDPVFLEALETMALAAKSDLPILIEGETGTGKSLVALAAHRASRRAPYPFVQMNCAAIPEPLLEDELFGHVRGAFTGAQENRNGLFATANGGTVFLDEVAEMSPGMQAKLLWVLEHGELRKVGRDRLEKVDVRIIAAAVSPLEGEVAGGRFREDLYYRLKGVKVKLPPLRQKKGDIPLLVRHFVAESCRQRREIAPTVSDEAMRCLMAYDYPGNCRELESIIRRALLFLLDGQIAPASLPAEVTAGAALPPGVEVPCNGGELRAAVQAARSAAAGRVEKAFLLRALLEAGGNVSRAARLTGMNRSQFHQMMSRHGIQRNHVLRGKAAETPADYRQSGRSDRES